MLKNLQRTGHARETARADVVVIGGGIAGLLLASRLAQSGTRTIVLESGTDKFGEELHPLNEVVQLGQPYRGATAGRFRGLGGTSARWGGAMLPFLSCDMGPHTAGWPVDWPVGLEALSPRFDDIERLFKLPAGPYEGDAPLAPQAADQPFILRSAKWPAFRLRNVARTLGESIRGPRMEVWLNATVTGFQLAENGRLAGATAVSPSGAELNVEADIVVVAAGAIESTRLLLLLDAQHDDRIFRPDDQLGRFFYDHLSTAVAKIKPADAAALNATFGLRFAHSGMRDLRIEPSCALRAQQRLPGAFAHIVALSDSDAGFAALRALYRDLQSRSPVSRRHAVGLGRDMPWLCKAAWWRIARGRLLYPPRSRFEMVLVVEQMPVAHSTITLAERAHDRLGSPLACIDWRTSEEDATVFRTLQAELTAWWRASRFAALGDLQPVAETCWRERLQQSADIFHPGGTTRMGRSPSQGVVDADLRTFRVENLYVVSTSTFPTGGSANPTFMLMAFALRAADHIAARLARSTARAAVTAPVLPHTAAAAPGSARSNSQDARSFKRGAP